MYPLVHRKFPKAGSGKIFVSSPTSKDIHTVLALWRVINVPKDGLTLESVIDVGQGISVGPGRFGQKNKHRALNKRRA